MAETRTFVAKQPFKPVFLAAAGQPPVPRERWIAMFEDWLLAIGFPTGDEYKRQFFEQVWVRKGTEFIRRWLPISVKITPAQRND